MTAAISLRDRLIELLDPVVRGQGLTLWELEFLPRSNGALLRLYIDVPEPDAIDADAIDSDSGADGEMAQGVTVDDCAKVSYAVSDALEVADPIPGHYTLEVSSPGLDRVLRTAAHFERFVGEPVRVELSTALNGRKKFSGLLLSADANEIEIEVDGAPTKLSLAAVHKARLASELAE